MARRPDISINKKKRTCKIVDFADLAGRSVRLKESEKKNNYFYLARELKKVWKLKVTFIPNEIGTLGTLNKELIKELEDLEIRGRVETIQTTALL